MALLARGTVADRPWGMTFGALGIRGLSGQLTLTADGKQFRVAFDQGVIIGAHSPLATDAAVRLALTMNLVTSSQVADITRRMAQAPDRDEIDVLVELARLSPDTAPRLRRRLVAQRAARTFAYERGDFHVEDQVTIPIVADGELDVRTIAYLGAKTNLSQERLAAELAQLGSYFVLKPSAYGDLPQFGFGAADQPIVQMIMEGAYVDEMVAAHPSVGERTVRAIMYALASCGALELGAPPRSPRAMTPSSAPTTRAQGGRDEMPTNMRSSHQTGSGVVRIPTSPGGSAGTPWSPAQPRMSTATSSLTTTPASTPTTSRTVTPSSSAPTVSPTSTGSGPTISRTSTGSGPNQTRSTTPTAGPPGRARSPSMAPPISLAKTPSFPPPSADDPAQMKPASGEQQPQSSAAATQSIRKPVGAAPPRRARRDSTATTEIEMLLTNKMPLLDRGTDHFTLLGLTMDASSADVRSAYFTLARKLHPDRLSAIGIEDEDRRAQRLMAQVNLAFATLNDAAKRDEYLSVLRRGGEAAVKAEEAQADELAMRIMRAEEAFKQGEMALRRDQLTQALEAFQMAVELQPEEAEYQALLAWVQFAAAPDKNAVANTTRKALQRAAETNDRSTTARFYLGRVERMLGREREALQYFEEVLAIKPSHADAASEARILKQRLNKR